MIELLQICAVSIVTVVQWHCWFSIRNASGL